MANLTNVELRDGNGRMRMEGHVNVYFSSFI